MGSSILIFVLAQLFIHAVELKSDADGENLMVGDWYPMIKKLSNIESDETKEWGYANALWEINKRIKGQ